MVAFFGKKKKEVILIFGTGSGGMTFYRNNCSSYRIIGFLDNNKKKHGQLLHGCPIYQPSDIESLLFDKIIIASDYHRDIYLQLTNELAIDENVIGVFHIDDTQEKSWWHRKKETLKLLCQERMCYRKDWLSSMLYYYFYGRQDNDNIRLMPFDWLENRHDLKTHIFRTSIVSQVYGPTFINNKATVEEILLPEVALYRFYNGKVKSVSRTVILSDKRIVIEKIPTARTPYADYSAAHLMFHGKYMAITRNESSETIPRGVLINGFSETNYYHLILEVISQLQFVNELPVEFSNYPILLSEHCNKIPAIKKILEHICINKELIFLNCIDTYQVEDLLYINMPNGWIPNLKRDAWSDVVNSFCREESIGFIRNAAYEISSVKKSDCFPKRIFLARKGSLRTYNQEEIIEALTPFGFSCIYFEEIEFCQQVMTMANADIIIGPTGAAWTNIIFAKPKAKALCWMAEEWGDLSCFSNLAAISKVDMTYISYCAGTTDSRELYYRKYVIQVSDVIDWVSHRI